jgi:Amt family ammonium transporter
VWGGGWLAQLGSAFGIGNGHVDYAGSSVVHMTGGVCALAGALVLGPRIGKYNKDGTVNVLPAHNVAMYMLGTFILAFGWFGFNPGSSFKATDLNNARVAVNTMLASASGAFAAMMYMWLVYGKPDPSFMCNGMLAGLVAITAPCAFITPLSAVIVGAVAGVLVILSCVFFEKIAKVDDPVGAISVHGVNGAWGVLALGLLADGTYGQGWNGAWWYKVNETKYEYSTTSLTGGTAKEALDAIADANKDKQGDEKITPPEFLTKLSPDAKLDVVGVTGLLYGSTGQFRAQVIGTSTNIVWVFLSSLAMFLLIEVTIGNRVSPEVELAGLDVPEMGIMGYINEDPKTPEGHLTSAGGEPRPAVAPPGGKRFVIVVDGVGNGELMHAWSEMCQPGKATDPQVFKEVYANMTTVQGGRFIFRGGDPERMRTGLETLLRGKLKGKLQVHLL